MVVERTKVDLQAFGNKKKFMKDNSQAIIPPIFFPAKKNFFPSIRWLREYSLRIMSEGPFLRVASNPNKRSFAKIGQKADNGGLRAAHTSISRTARSGVERGCAQALRDRHACPRVLFAASNP